MMIVVMIDYDDCDYGYDNDVHLTLSPCNAAVPSHERRGRCRSRGGSRLPVYQGLAFLKIIVMMLVMMMR